MDWKTQSEVDVLFDFLESVIDFKNRTLSPTAKLDEGCPEFEIEMLKNIYNALISSESVENRGLSLMMALEELWRYCTYAEKEDTFDDLFCAWRRSTDLEF